MDFSDVSVSLEAVITAAGILLLALVGLLIRWIDGNFRRNDTEHRELNTTIHKRTSRIEGRLDHVIRYHDRMPPYFDDPEDEEPEK